MAISGDTILVDGLRNLSEGADILVGGAMNKSAVEELRFTLSNVVVWAFRKC